MELKRDKKVPKFIGWDANELGYITVPNGEPKSPSSPFKKLVSYMPVTNDEDGDLDSYCLKVFDIDDKIRLINILTGQYVD